MKIYKAEKDIQNIIKANTAIAYTAEINKSDYMEVNLNNFTINDEQIKEIVTASLKDKELYYHTSILVTTSWNKNDDVFTPGVVWAAKDTPVHKPTNIEHDSMKIIGHMTGSWAIDKDGKIIDAGEETTELPSKFHILVGSVIYRRWPSNDEYETDIAKLIETIEAGEKFVSMECTFKDFDYAIEDEEGITIIARNEDTAFLSKHLRVYGGEGYWKKKKVGRVVKAISFCGKGYVDKPANPESIIFTKDNISDFSSAKKIEKIIISKESGVISNIANLMENKIMPDNNFYQEQNQELKEQNAVLAKSLEEMKEKITQSNVSKLEKEIETLTAQTSDMNEVIKTKSGELTAKEKEVSDLNIKVDNLTKANDELIKVNKELTDKLSQIEAESKMTARVSTLVAGGLTKETAEEKAKLFANLNDDQFGAVTQEIIKANKITSTDTENPGKVEAEEIDSATVVDEEVTSASVSENSGSVDISGLAKKLSEVFGRK